MKIKEILLTFLIGAVGWLVLLFALSKITPQFVSKIFANISSERVIERIEREVKIVPQEEAITEQINKVSKSIVLIQTFSQGKLLRYGSGAILTNDGLIITTNNVVPPVAGSIQVFTDEKISRATVVSRDFSNNLALLEIEPTNHPSISFSQDPLKVGEIKYIVGKYLDVNIRKYFVQQALVSRKTRNLTILDAVYNDDLSGSVLVNRNGEVRALVFIDGSRVLAVESEVIRRFFETYTAKVHEEQRQNQ